MHSLNRGGSNGRKGSLAAVHSSPRAVVFAASSPSTMPYVELDPEWNKGSVLCAVLDCTLARSDMFLIVAGCGRAGEPSCGIRLRKPWGSLNPVVGRALDHYCAQPSFLCRISRCYPLLEYGRSRSRFSGTTIGIRGEVDSSGQTRPTRFFCKGTALRPPVQQHSGRALKSVRNTDQRYRATTKPRII